MQAVVSSVPDDPLCCGTLRNVTITHFLVASSSKVPALALLCSAPSRSASRLLLSSPFGGLLVSFQEHGRSQGTAQLHGMLWDSNFGEEQPLQQS